MFIYLIYLENNLNYLFVNIENAANFVFIKMQNMMEYSQIAFMISKNSSNL